MIQATRGSISKKKKLLPLAGLILGVASLLTAASSSCIDSQSNRPLLPSSTYRPLLLLPSSFLLSFLALLLGAARIPTDQIAQVAKVLAALLLLRGFLTLQVEAATELVSKGR